MALVYLIIPGLVDSISKLAASLPSYVQEIQTWITGLQHGSVELKNTINTIIARASDAFENWMQNDFIFTWVIRLQCSIFATNLECYNIPVMNV